MAGDEEVERCGFGNCCGYGNFKANKKSVRRIKYKVWQYGVNLSVQPRTRKVPAVVVLTQYVEVVAVVPAPAENSSQSSSSDQPTDSQTHAAARKEVKTRPTPKQAELKEKM